MKITFEDPIDGAKISVDDNCLEDNQIHVQFQMKDVEALFVFGDPVAIRYFIGALQTMRERLENHLNKSR